ncbi:preprotein translocase subunit SecA [Dyadobacter fanqingshengii]|uniref:Protein translocase subunit SecA n=1 Tax=Dyadobacter fanqingshengii TaxID=2906443 RepID=A0A9X1PDZ6_9BACT|nr:preprotein translocase subunit SecA [Dyadobacter fanqingshengii]MCF0042389.1 preprotein translocase subunit SecA [Dyadobacter fanqingshengii]USJ35085.1 preprotein translocase subunit SecA [Dyadobacter fanqingshengii]
MFKIFSKLFGTKSERDLKELTPYVDKVSAEYALLASLTNDELRAKSEGLKQHISDNLKSIDDQIAVLRQQAADEPNVDSKEAIFKKIDALDLDRNKELERILLDILPEAFAIVKETARRFKENDKLEVTASFFDREVATKKSHVVIEGDKAYWNTTWDVIGQPIKWNMLHYDVQLIGGVVLHQGKIAEMATGEGKTLVATLPAFLNALAGNGVHIVTVNDYLAKRDAEWNAPLFEFHGMSVDCIDRHQPNTIARRNAYKASLTYGTNNEFGFDYLRDNMSRTPEELVQRKHHFAMVDEVDSVLIDDARTPLIISGPVPRGDEQEYLELKPRVSRIVEAQKKLAMDFLNDARKKIAAGDKKEGALSLFRAHRGMPKYKPLIKYLSESGIKALMQESESIYLAENQKLMPVADEPLYFTIDERHNSIELTEKGIDFLTGESEESNFFILPDIAVDLDVIEKDTSLNEQERIIRKEALIRDYSIKTARIHTVNQLLKAFTLFEKDVEYVIMDGKVKIVDEQTGRIMDGRRYSDGLHQAIEAKENVRVEDATQTYATVTLQNYFRMYHKLAGMTGTAETEAGEFWEIYKLDVVSIPTNVNAVRKDHEDKVYRSVREKYNAVTDEIVELVEAGRPVLVGTTSVENSEIISRMLTLRKIQHQVLNAKQHQREAEVVTEAGKPGTVTIATNMAGRGTDIKLTPESKQAGGLAIIGTERHESRRVDRQLRGRSGRQGDPGSSQFFVSLEDNLMRLFGSDRMAKVMDRMGLEEGEVIQSGMITKSIERAQKKVEENNFGMRKRLLEYDDVMNYQRDAIYTRRRNALFGERLAVDIANTLYDVCDELVSSANSYAELELAVITTLGMEVPYSESEYGSLKPADRSQKLYSAAEKQYQDKNSGIAEKALPVLSSINAERGATISEIMIPFSDGIRQTGVVVGLKKAIENGGKEITNEMEKAIVLSLIDQEWKEHLREMDDLKQSVQNAVFEQKDPLLIYKFESVELFKRFLSKVNFDMISFLMKADIPQEEAVPATAVQQTVRRPAPAPALHTNREEDFDAELDGGPNEYARNMESTTKAQPVRTIKIADRNQKVSVQYRDGRILRDVKFKKVEQEVKNGDCVVIE